MSTWLPSASAFRLAEVAAIEAEQVRLIREYLASQPAPIVPRIAVKWWVPVSRIEPHEGLRTAMDNYERSVIRDVLDRTRSVHQAAAVLQIPRTTLVTRMERLGMTTKRGEKA